MYVFQLVYVYLPTVWPTFKDSGDNDKQQCSVHVADIKKNIGKQPVSLEHNRFNSDKEGEREILHK